MDNQKGFEDSGVDDILRQFDEEKKKSEEINFKKLKFVGNTTRDNRVDKEFYDTWFAAFGNKEEEPFEVDDSYKNIVRFSEMVESLEELLNELKEKPIVRELKEKANISNLKEQAKKTDTWKTLVETITSIKQSINEIVLLTDPMLQVGEEAKERGLNSPILDKLDNEIEEIQELQGYDFDRAVKQVIGKKVVGIGKTTIKGAVTLGFNAIGTSVKGIRKIVDKVNDFRNRRANDIEEEQSFENEENFIEENEQFYGYEEKIEKVDDEYNDEYVNYDSTSQDIPFDLSQHTIKTNGELDLSKYNVKDNENILEEIEVEEKEKKENLAQKTIKGVKKFGTGVREKFKWVKDREKRQAFLNKQIKRITNSKPYKEVSKFGKSVKNEVKETIDNVETTVSDIVDDINNTYKQAVERYNKRKNDKLIDALKKGSDFSEEQIKAIKEFIKENGEKDDEVKQPQEQTRKVVDKNTISFDR